MRARPVLVESPPQTEIFRDRLAALGLSVRQFAALSGVHYSTALGWGTIRATGAGRAVQAFPTWVELLLREWEAHGVPAESPQKPCQPG
jgi:hypothetical protein